MILLGLGIDDLTNEYGGIPGNPRYMKGVHTQTHHQPIGRVETAQVFLANRSENWFEVKLAGNPC